MPAPRLLPKALVNATLATEQKVAIDQGIAIAKKVDAVRETLGEEEARLDSFRKETIAKVQAEIDAKIAEKDALEVGNKKLREERIKAEAPIDLRTEWLLVEEDKREITNWKDRLGEQSIQLLAKEEDNSQKEQELAKQRIEIDKAANLTQQNLSAAELKYEQADDLLRQTRIDVEAEKKLSAQRENHLRVREEDATNREIALSEREHKVDAHEIDLSNREIKLRNRQETFLKAQAYIKSKKKL